MRKIVYVSGTRADFGLMQLTLLRAAKHPELDISICVTGMHLSPHFGETVKEIEQTGLPICGRVAVDIEQTSGASMAKAIGDEIKGMVDIFTKEQPDLVMVLGDRGEQLAGALAAIHLNIPVVHLHGGERSGTIDEPVRHAISKLAHYHFVATDGSRERLIRMGEQEKHIFITGAPGLDGLTDTGQRSRKDLCQEYQLDADQPVALVVYHPVVQEESDLTRYTQVLIEALLESSLQTIWLLPNADAGGNRIRIALQSYESKPGLRFLVHLPRVDFISWMACADVMVGNSSSGIIEAASFGLPVVNVGSRQHGRERSSNVCDVSTERSAISQALDNAIKSGKTPIKNVYGDGQTGERIVNLLATLPLTAELLKKSNAY